MGLPVAQTVKNLPAMQETQVWSLGQEDLLEKTMANHFSTLAWQIPWTEKPGGLYSPWGHQRVGHDWVTKRAHTHIFPWLLLVLCRISPLLDIKFLENRNLFPSLTPLHQCFITPQPFKKRKMAVMLNCIPTIFRQSPLWKLEWALPFPTPPRALRVSSWTSRDKIYKTCRD